MPWISLAIAGVILFIALGIFLDFKFYILSLLWLCILSPLMLIFLYFVKGFKPLSVLNTVPHDITVSNKKIVVSINPVLKDEDEPVSAPKDKERKVEADLKNLVKIMNSTGGWILFFDNEPSGFLWIPYGTFSTDFSSQKFFSSLSIAKT